MPVKMLPWYKGFQGTIEELSHGKGFSVTGCYEIKDDNTLEITELPVGKWTRDYKNFLEELIAKEEFENILEYHAENRVHFVLTGVVKLKELEEKGDVVKHFKLQTTIPSTNYVLFNHEGKIQRFEDELHVLKEFFPLRGKLY